MSNLDLSRFAARIEFLMLRYQAPAIVLTSVALLSPLALLPLVGGPVASAMLASSTVAMTFLTQGQIARRLFRGPPASAALIGVARDALPLACRATFDLDVIGELELSRKPLSASRVIELHRSARRNWKSALGYDEARKEQYRASQFPKIRD